MAESLERKIVEFLDNVILMRMEDDLNVLGKRLGYATKKKDEMAGTKKWWKLVELTKDERHGINPLTQRGEEKKKRYAELEKSMRKNGEEIVYDDEDALSGMCQKLLDGDHSSIFSLILLTYIKYCQDVYGGDMEIESKGESFEKVEMALFGNEKKGEEFLAKLRLEFGKLSSLPKISNENVGKSLPYILGILSDEMGIREARDYLNAFGMKEGDSFDGDDIELVATKLSLALALAASAKSSPYSAVYSNKFLMSYMEMRSEIDDLLKSQDYASARKIVKVFHRFEDEFLDIVCA